MRNIEKIIIHCSATPEGRDYSVQDIDRWHKARRFRCIGYHYVIYRDGSIHFGRPIEQAGAHCYGQNRFSIGICYIGGLAKDGKTPMDSRTPEQKLALRRLLTELHSEFPKASLHGHREFAKKACPCFDVQEYRDIFNQ